MSYKKERSMKLQDKVKRLLAANAELRETIKAKDKEIEEANRFISLMCGKCAYKQDSVIEAMKCCGNCANTEFDGGMGSCCKFDDLGCEGLSHWVLRR